MADIRREISFLLNDREIRLSEVGASDTLLDFLRLDQRLTGTKEGCAEGDCGACSVLAGRLDDGALRYEAVNACIRLLPSLDGRHIVTIEHLASADGGLHPVQQAMLEHHGSQCGFCTPGIVMSLWALWMENADPDDEAIETALQGNLCRCTGYAPIIRAAKAAARKGEPARDAITAERAAITAKLTAMQNQPRAEIARGDDRAILPSGIDDLAEVLLKNQNATIISGATDAGLWVTKFMRPISPAVFIGHIDELRSISLSEDALTIGAAASYSDSMNAIESAFPWLVAYWKRIGGWQVRNMGTIGGNIANGSPIGDTPPPLIALGAQIALRKGDERRTIPLEEFFIDYGKQDRAAGEFIKAIRIPRPGAGTHCAAYKLSKRRDEDISSVAAGFCVTVENEQITSARIAFGGMAATPRRAAKAEAALTGAPWSEDSFAKAASALAKDFDPLTDWRASAEYRMRAAQNLFRRFWLEKGEAAQCRLVKA